MNIIEAILDDQLFRPFLQDRSGSVQSWMAWQIALRALLGLPYGSDYAKQLVKSCTGRDVLPATGFQTALFLTGRRSGKSRISAIIGAFEAILAGHEKKLAKGERGYVVIVAPSKAQGRIVRDYLRAIFEAPLLAGEVVAEEKTGFTLRSGVRLEIMAGDFRTVRGFTLLAAIVDEAAFFGVDEEAKIKSDTELVRALGPALATTKGRLVAISSPYAKRGWTYSTYKRHFGNASSKVLVWNCPSRTMNETLDQAIVDEALAEDYAAAQAEYLGMFRDDVGLLIPREVVERLVVKDRSGLPPRDGVRYVAFADVSGGRGDDAALAIAHKEEGKTIIDLLRRFRPPCNPHEVIQWMAEDVKRFGIRRISGDAYAADFVDRAFVAAGVHYTKADKPKSALYLELLPVLSSGAIELLDVPLLVNQIAALERRTRAGGKDIVDHPTGGHDDLANVVAGVTDLIAHRVIRIGGAVQQQPDTWRRILS